MPGFDYCSRLCRLFFEVNYKHMKVTKDDNINGWLSQFGIGAGFSLEPPPELCGVQEFLIFIYSIHICCILNYSSGNWEFIQPLLFIILII